MFPFWLINGLFLAYEALIVARVVLSWVPHDPRQAPFDIIYTVTEPLISTCREMLYSIYRLLGVDGRQMTLDFSPWLALLFVHLLRGGVLKLLALLLA